MATEKKKFDLKYPFEHRGATYVEMNARRPKVRDLRNFIKNVDKEGMQAMEKVLADLMEIDTQVVAEIDVEDFAPMKAWFESFLEKMTGESEES
jgi:hypothetical protein